MQTKKYLLRAEAVNLAHFVYDTHKIPVIRGGGFLLLDAVKSLEALEPKNVKLEKITTGASIGLFSFEAEVGKDNEVILEVTKHLNDKTGHHATFVVDTVEYLESTFQEDLNRLVVKNRFHQFQQPTLVLPEMNKYKDKCDYDGIRPGETRQGIADISSDSVSFRLESGRGLRQKIYQQLSKGIPDDLQFTNDLDALSNNDKMGNLKGKIAHIYIDGNSFTAIRKNKCGEKNKLKNFSDYLEEKQTLFLENLLATAKKDNSFMNGKEICLETLLWGGDEIEIIVPAWKGWQVMKSFYDGMKDVEFEGIDLTHAGSLIFCHHNAPILQVRSLAKKMVDKVKQTIKKDSLDKIKHDSCDAFHCLVLESFDTVGANLDGFIKTYYPNNAFKEQLIKHEDMCKINIAIKTMKEEGFPRNKLFPMIKTIANDPCFCSSPFPRNKLFPMIKTLRKSGYKSRKSEFNKAFDDALSGLGEEEKKLIEENMKKVVGENELRAYLFADLWDYAGRQI